MTFLTVSLVPNWDYSSWPEHIIFAGDLPENVLCSKNKRLPYGASNMLFSDVTQWQKTQIGSTT